MAVKVINGRQTINAGSMLQFADGALEESEGAGNMQVLWDQAFYQITTDAGVFGNPSAFFMDQDIVFFQAPDGQGGINQFLLDDNIRYDLGTGGILNRFFVELAAGGTIFELYRDTVNNQNVLKMVIPVFADNAAAIAGGLVTGGVYKTAGGSLLIVV